MERRNLLRGVIAAILGTYTVDSISKDRSKHDAKNSMTIESNSSELNINLTKNDIGDTQLTTYSKTSNEALSGIPLSDWIYGNTRSIFLYLTPQKVSSLKKGETVDVTIELNQAMKDNMTIFLPNGQYSIRQTILVGINSSLIGNGAKTVYIDNQSNDHAFTFPIGYTRGTKDFFGFSIGSKKISAVNKYAFYFSAAEDGRLDYSAGWRFSCIELYGFGMGGGWFLQDCFRVTIRDCGSSGLSNPFYILGSVVQLTVDNFVNNGDKFPKTILGSFGVYMATKKYHDGHGIKMPEGITFINCKFVRQDVGAHALGLYVQFVNTEFDYSSKCGAYYAGGDKVDFINCYVASQSSRKNDFSAFEVSSMSAETPEPVLISNCTINMQKNTLSGYHSYGVLLSGGKGILKACKVENCFFRGTGYDACIYIFRCNGIIIRGNSFRVKGVNVKLNDVGNLTLCDNYGMGNYLLENPRKDSCWIVTGNTGAFSEIDTKDIKKFLIINQSYSL